MIIDTIRDVVKVSRMKESTYASIYTNTAIYSSKRRQLSPTTFRLQKEFAAVNHLDTAIAMPEQILTTKLIDNFVKYEQLDNNIKLYRKTTSMPEVEVDIVRLYQSDPSFHSVINQASQKIFKFHITIEFKKTNYKPTEDDEPRTIIEAKISQTILGRWTLINVQEKKSMKEIVARSLMELLFPRIYKVLMESRTKTVENLDDILNKDEDIQHAKVVPEDDNRVYYDLGEMIDDFDVEPMIGHSTIKDRLKHVNHDIVNDVNDNNKRREKQKNAVNERWLKEADEFVYNSQIAREELRNFEEFYADILPPLRNEFILNYTMTPNLLNYKNKDEEKRFFIDMVIYDYNTYKILRTKLFRYFYDEFKKSTVKISCYPVQEADGTYTKYELKVNKKDLLVHTELEGKLPSVEQYFKFMFLTKILLTLNL